MKRLARKKIPEKVFSK